jgi:hypothetical protein
LRSVVTDRLAWTSGISIVTATGARAVELYEAV